MPPQLLTFHPLQQKLFLSVKSGWFDAFVVFPVRPLMCQHRPNYPGEFMAIATITTFSGRRFFICSTQGPGAFTR